MYVFCRTVAVITDNFFQRYSNGKHFMCARACVCDCEVGTECFCSIYVNFELKGVTYAVSLSHTARCYSQKD